MWKGYRHKRVFFPFQCENDEEIVAVIAHELGHWKLNHTMYTFIAVQVFPSF
jgi:Zn-dependent protease with chaperone function